MRTRPSKRARLSRRINASLAYNDSLVWLSYMCPYALDGCCLNLNVSAPMPTLESM
jgi:hypothetical protein